MARLSTSGAMRFPLLLLLGLLAVPGARAEGLTEADFQREREQVVAEYESSRRACAELSGNGADICIAEAIGAKNLANARLDSRYRPSPEHSDQVRVAKEDETYGVASERCNELFGNTRDICLKDAGAAKNLGKENLPGDEAGDGHRDGRSETSVEERRHHVSDRMDEDYLRALKTCRKRAGHDKAACLARVKIRFGKN